MMKRILFTVLLSISILSTYAQVQLGGDSLIVDYGNPKQEKFVIHLHDVLPCRFLAFKSLSLRDQFAANFADLIEAAKPLLG
mgnify:CR=1 FL=1